LIRLKVSIAHGPDFKAMSKSARQALANGINRTLEEAQTAQRQSMARNFVDRPGGVVLANMVKIAGRDRATPDNLIGRIRIIGPEGAENLSTLLTRHEDPPPVTTAGGGYSIDPSVRIGGFFYLPTKTIRPTFPAVIPRSLYPSNLRLVDRHDVVGILRAKVHTTGSGQMQLKGNKRTFVLFGANGGGPIGIFQRAGSKGKLGGRGRSKGRRTLFVQGSGPRQSDDIQLIWAFRRTIHLKPRLHFYDIVPRTIGERLPVNYSGFVAAAMRASK